MTATPHGWVNDLLRLYIDSLPADIRDEITALYLYGSLASGGFDDDSSDIDALAVTKDVLTDAQVDALRAFHDVLSARAPEVNRRFEVYYLPQNALDAWRADDPLRSRWNNGKFVMAQQGGDWVLHRKILREQGIVVFGPHPSEFIAPVTAQQVQRGMATLLLRLWEPYIGDPRRLDDPFFQSYAIMTMCRALYLLEHGDNIPKRAASAWGRVQLPDMAAAIDAAALWRAGDSIVFKADALKLIALAVETARKFS